LLEANPTWSPAATKSALMTTARQDITLDDGETDALPFDFGAGHIVPNSAIDPGLVYDVSDDEFDAFACGIASPAISGDRCDELNLADFSFAGEDLNQASIAIAALTSQQTVTRHVTNVSEEAATYTAEIVPPPGISVSVLPNSITVAPGATASFDVTLDNVSGQLDQWQFGSLTWSNNEHSVYSTLAVRPSTITGPGEVFGARTDGNLSFSVEFGYTGAYLPGVHGLSLPLVVNGFVDNDPNKTFTFRTDNGVTAHLIDVPVQQAFMRFSLFDALTDGNDDLDMYVYFCENNIDCVKIGESGNPTSKEQFNLFYPAAGRYAVLIHGFETDQVAGGPGANYQLLATSFGLVDDRGNMTATGPSFVNTGATETITVDWTGLQPTTLYLGGISHNTPNGIAGFTVVTIDTTVN
jgi:hypothetical protein